MSSEEARQQQKKKKKNEKEDIKKMPELKHLMYAIQSLYCIYTYYNDGVV